MKSFKEFLIHIYGTGRKFLIQNATLLLSILFIILFIYFIETLRRDMGLANALVAFGTLILALATLLHIIKSNEQEKHRREENILNEIIEWALEIWKCGLEVDLPSEFERTDEGYLNARTRSIQMTNVFKELLRRSHYIKEIILPTWQKLNDTMEELREQLDAQIELIDKYKDDIKNESKRKAVDANRSDINRLTYKIVQEAAKIKTRDID